MSSQANISAIERFGEAAQRGDDEVFSAVVAPDCVDHDPAPGQEPGPAGYQAFFAEMRRAFPDMKIKVEHMVSDDENVAFAYTLTGTHQGPFQGVPATGRPVQARGMQISRFRDGKMVERWGSSDELGILKQLGAA